MGVSRMTCPVCGCEFQTNHHRQKFCSHECYTINHRKLSRERLRAKHGYNARPEQYKAMDNDNVRVELVEAMRAKYANIDIDEEIDIWFGISKG
jgi:protein-arginine kinase activator protein McsA